MSESYVIEGVTITPGAGGYYGLTHPSLAEAERVRGKETAEQRAGVIAAAARGSEGSMPPQPELQDVVTQPEEVSGIDELKALVARQSAMLEQLLTAQAATVVTTGEGAANPFSTMPPEYSGQVSDKTRRAAKELGIEYVTIILEEGNDIPPTGLFLGHNGRSYMIVPGEPVDVPDFLLGVLNDAVMASPLVDSKTNKILGYRSRTKYPYRRV